MEKLLTAKQVSGLLEVHLSTVYEWVNRGSIPYVKLGRLVRFKKAEIFRWIDSHEIRPKSVPSRKKTSPPASLQREFPL